MSTAGNSSGSMRNSSNFVVLYRACASSTLSAVQRGLICSAARPKPLAEVRRISIPSPIWNACRPAEAFSRSREPSVKVRPPTTPTYASSSPPWRREPLTKRSVPVDPDPARRDCHRHRRPARSGRWPEGRPPARPRRTSSTPGRRAWRPADLRRERRWAGRTTRDCSRSTRVAAVTFSFTSQSGPRARTGKDGAAAVSGRPGAVATVRRTRTPPASPSTESTEACATPATRRTLSRPKSTNRLLYRPPGKRLKALRIASSSSGAARPRRGRIESDLYRLYPWFSTRENDCACRPLGRTSVISRVTVARV